MKRLADEITPEDLAAMTPAERRETTRLLVAEDAKVLPHHLGEYVRGAWHVVEPAVTYRHNWHIDVEVEHLEAVSRGEIRNLLVNVPPGTMKSLLCSVFFQTWEWLERPALRYIYTSYAEGLATRDSVKCRRIIASQWYQERWGNRYRLTSDQNVKTKFENDKTGYRFACGIRGQITGEHGDRLVADDPHKVLEVESDVMREDVIEWWDKVMSTRWNDPKTVAKIVVMQRIHAKDLSGHILSTAKDEGWVHLMLPMEYEPRPFIVVGAAAA